MVKKKTLILTFVTTVLFVVSVGAVVAQTYTNTFIKDGKTYVQTKTVLEDKILIETKIYDSGGQLLETKEVEKELKATPVKEQTYPTKTVTSYPTKIPVSTKSEEPTPTVADEENIVGEKKEEPIFIRSNFPVGVDEGTGALVVSTSNGDKTLNTKPSAILSKARQNGLDTVGDVKLVEDQDRFRYRVEGVKRERFLALFQIYLPIALIFDTDTGELEKVEQSGFVKFADTLSF